jgi:prepilin-type N-terminal cleavage/methylation domain-containing protein
MQSSKTRLALGRTECGFTLVELLVVIAIIGILVALLLPAVQSAREAARRAQCQSNLRNVALAVLNYESAHKRFPMGTQFPELTNGYVPNIQSRTDFGESWVITVLPFMEGQALYDALVLENPSNGEPVAMQNALNIEQRGTELPVMLCPTDENNNVKYEGHGGNWARGNYAASVGLGALHPGAPPLQIIMGPTSSGWNGVSHTTGMKVAGAINYLVRGVMGPNAAVKLAQITDGTSNTIMLGEIRAGVQALDPRGTWAFGHAGGNLLAHYGFNGDDAGPNYSGDPNADDIGSSGGRGSDFSCTDPYLMEVGMPCYGGTSSSAFDQATTRSMHVGGVFMAMCDGSVQFVDETIETVVGPGTRCCSPWDHMVASQDGGSVQPLPGRGG